MLLWTLVLMGCASMEDNSLEAPTVWAEGGEGEGGRERTGRLSATGGENGDWQLTVGDVTWQYHSPSRVDFSELDGDEVTVWSSDAFRAGASLVITDAAGPVFVQTTSPGEDGSAHFGRPVWVQGDPLGRGTIEDGFETGSAFELQDVKFTDVVVTSDSGDVHVLPGEPTSLPIEGDTWRFAVLSAYVAVNPGNSKCGAPDVLAVELIRTEGDPGPALQRAEGTFPYVGSCN